MKKFWIYGLVSLFVVSCGKNKKSTIHEAFSWVPPGATQVMFDDWSQIRKDFGFSAYGYWKGEWIPEAGTNTSKSDNFLPFANSVFESVQDTVESRKLGFTIAELEWQIAFGNTGIKKFSNSYNEEAFEQFCKKGSYKKVEIMQKSVYVNDHSVVNPMLRYLYFDSDSKTLVHSYDEQELEKIIVAHSEEKSILTNEQVSSMLDHLENVESLYFTVQRPMDPALMVTGQFSTEEVQQRFAKDFGQVFMGLEDLEEQQLACPLYWCMAEKKQGGVINVLAYENEEKAKTDEALRLKILNKGVSLQTKQPLTDLFKNVKSKSKGTNVVLEWTIPANRLILTHIANMDTPWNMCPF